ncbi:hypothetical protein N7520_006891 [Penicillium odoratum]|uniref:uncharacterized protein n=1 Tax=Penicillium odoratum TaxID=1167516 RepID=UPI0025492EAB|nr:uncharacterized protein N7520_006891 [Penicillium odoratum]KAJ5759735.1 hypothetical protein N7520_006891 [Penicillium odoratum]
MSGMFMIPGWLQDPSDLHKQQDTKERGVANINETLKKSRDPGRLIQDIKVLLQGWLKEFAYEILIETLGTQDTS